MNDTVTDVTEDIVCRPCYDRICALGETVAALQFHPSSVHSEDTPIRIIPGTDPSACDLMHDEGDAGEQAHKECDLITYSSAECGVCGTHDPGTRHGITTIYRWVMHP